MLVTADLCLPDPSMICWALHGQKLMQAELHCCWVSPKAISLHQFPQLGVNCLTRHDWLQHLTQRPGLQLSADQRSQLANHQEARASQLHAVHAVPPSDHHSELVTQQQLAVLAEDLAGCTNGCLWQ